jgi:hypothetical protein
MIRDDGDGRTFDRRYELLSHPTRRALLRTLRENGSTTIDAAAADLVDAGERGPAADGGSVDSERLTVSLYHVHLPKMADSGVIDYEPATGTIRANDATEQLYGALDDFPRRDG